MIKPSWAASTWVIDETLYFDLPGPGEQSHQLCFPATSEGLAKALKMLRERGGASTIGTRGDPTQWQIDMDHRAYQKAEREAYIGYAEDRVRRVGRPKVRIAPELATAARDVLRRLGMI